MIMDTLSLSRLPEEDRLEAQRWAEAFAGITGPVTEAFVLIAAQMDKSVSTVIRRYYAWQKRGVAGLVNGSRNPDFAVSRWGEGEVAPETFAYYRRLCVENGRKCRAAYKKLCREFFTEQDIPGVPPGTDRYRLPDGWSYSNFQRHAPTKFELKAARQGLRSAADFRPLVYTSRREMHLFQELQFDDVWHDVETVLLDRAQRVRPQQLGAMDVFSACLFEWCIKPRIRRDDDTRVSLNPNDMLFLLAAVFGKYGHHPNGTRLNLEAGTATVPQSTIDLIHKLSGGKVTCRIGATNNASAFAGQFPGVSKGNFRTRALIESFWNLTHNETGERLMFPGQTGSLARVNAPDDLTGRGKEMDLLLRAMPALPEWVFANLRKPLPEFTEAVRAIGEINERMNRRGIMPGTDHAIEGFVEAGLVTTDFDLPGVGVITRAEFEERLKGRPPEEQSAIMAVCRAQARKLSPREAFDSRRGELVPWRREALAQLLYAARRPEVSRVTKSHLVVIEDRDVAPSPLRFLAHHFSPGDEFETVINPMVPEMLFIYDARRERRGSWLGTLKLWGGVNRADDEAVQRRIGMAEQVKRELLAPVQAMAGRMSRERADDLEHNNAVLGSHAQQTQADRREAREALMNVPED
jgi:hypothetical protein